MSRLMNFPLSMLLSAAAVLAGSQARSEDFSWQESGAGLATARATNTRSFVVYTIVRVDRAALRRDLGIVSTHANNTIVGLSTLSDQAETLPKELGTPVAGINGDFFMMNGSSMGDPRGLQILDGELISVPTGAAAFWQDGSGDFHAESVSSRLTLDWPGGGSHLAGLNEQLNTNEIVLFTPRMGSLNTNNRGDRPGRGGRFNGGRGNGWRGGSMNSPFGAIPQGGPIRPPGGREFFLEPASGPWLPLRVGQTYQAKVRGSSDGFTNVPPGLMLMMLGSELVATLPPITNETPVTIRVATSPDLTGVQHALGGGPLLVHAGKTHDVSARMSDEPHPRAALGWNDHHLYLVVADSIQTGMRFGVRLIEMAEFMIDLGCREAINLDGGRSNTLMLNGRVINHPMQGEPREIANGLVILRR
jgi:hypothetical protein